MIEPAKQAESKTSSSPRKEREKSQSNTAIKSPIGINQPRNESKKSSQSTPAPVKKTNPIVMKERVSSMQNQNKFSTISDMTIVNQVTTSASVADSSSILERMKDIDLKMMEMMMKKTVIDEKIMHLHKEKCDIDQATMKLQQERFSLLSSLLGNSAIGAKRINELPRDKVEPKVVELSSDDEALTMGPTKKVSSKSFKTIAANAPHNNSKRKHDDDSKTDSVDSTKCKKLKINLNSLKSLGNSKSNARNHVDVDEMQSDLKIKNTIKNGTRRCTIRLTKLSTKKINLLIGKGEMAAADRIGDASSELLKDSVDPIDKIIFDGNFRGHRLPIVHLQVKYRGGRESFPSKVYFIVVFNYRSSMVVF